VRNSNLRVAPAVPTVLAMEQKEPQGPDAPLGYEPPQVTDYGSLTEITAASAAGGFTDKAFPAGTPRGDLTFS
jgi:hypothetical protein